MRRRTSRTILAAGAALCLLLVACGGEEGTGADEPAPTDEGASGDDGAADEPAPDPDDESPTEEPADDGEAEPADDGGVDEPADDGEVEPAASPEPDPAQVADPCADHADRTDEAFIELVAPVNEQVVGDEVDLVGCSNVFEATVSWRLLDGDGAELDAGFTTAECGTGCVGAFDDVVPLDAAEGEPVAYLQVFWEDASDGSDRDLTEVILVLE